MVPAAVDAKRRAAAHRASGSAAVRIGLAAAVPSPRAQAHQARADRARHPRLPGAGGSGARREAGSSRAGAAPAADPADELRQKLAESRDEEPEPEAPAVPEATVEERRAEVHEQGRADARRDDVLRRGLSRRAVADPSETTQVSREHVAGGPGRGARRGPLARRPGRRAPGGAARAPARGRALPSERRGAPRLGGGPAARAREPGWVRSVDSPGRARASPCRGSSWRSSSSSPSRCSPPSRGPRRAGDRRRDGRGVAPRRRRRVGRVARRQRASARSSTARRRACRARCPDDPTWFAPAGRGHRARRRRANDRAATRLPPPQPE